jgi:hypothetical protein
VGSSFLSRSSDTTSSQAKQPATHENDGTEGSTGRYHRGAARYNCACRRSHGCLVDQVHINIGRFGCVFEAVGNVPKVSEDRSPEFRIIRLMTK